MRSRERLASLFLIGLFLILTCHARHVNAQLPPGTKLIPVPEEFDEAEDLDGPTARKHAPISNGGQIARTIQKATANGTLSIVPLSAIQLPSFSRFAPSKKRSGGNVQVNDPAFDFIQSFPGITRPFEESTQSETSVVRNGNHVVVGYNTSAGEPIIFIPGAGLFALEILFSGYSYSDDGGTTWTSGFLPPPPGSVETFGDPALASDRAGNIYYSNLAGDESGNTVVAVSKSTDFGHTWSPAVIVNTNNGDDKDWIAVGPDPANPAVDNVYVTWTIFPPTGGSELWFGKSGNGGQTWTTKRLFAPAGDANLSNQIQFSNPIVDPGTGRLYIPFLHFSNFDADMIRVLVSDDGGNTFSFLKFNVPGAFDAFGYPNVTPGELVDCGSTNGGFRNVLHQGTPTIGQFGLRRFVHATRLVTQPSAGAFRGRFFLAFQTSTSPFFGDPNAGSSITVLYSQDGGQSWASPVSIPATTADPQHVHPSLSVLQNGNELKVGYYVQQADTKLRTDLATVHVDGNHLKVQSTSHLSDVSFDLTPSNISFPTASNPFNTTNYDRTVRACYNIGEYMSVAAGDDGVASAWGDNRNPWTSPPDSPAAGTHAQADVFYTQASK